MRAFIFILHTPDTFCITFVQIASFFIQTFLLILCEKRSSCGLDDVGCGWLGPSQEEGGGGGGEEAASGYSESARTQDSISRYKEGRKRRKTFMQLTMHATIYACTLQKQKRGLRLAAPSWDSGYFVYIFIPPCVYIFVTSVWLPQLSPTLFCFKSVFCYETTHVCFRGTRIYIWLLVEE